MQQPTSLFSRSLDSQVHSKNSCLISAAGGGVEEPKMTVRGVTRRIGVCLLAAGAIASSSSVSLRAQSAESSDAKRKVKFMGRPVYPDLARKLNLTGVVKIEVVIGPDGKVKRTRVIGGHPVLAAEAERAAQNSEFEPGPKETMEVIDFKFTP